MREKYIVYLWFVNLMNIFILHMNFIDTQWKLTLVHFMYNVTGNLFLKDECIYPKNWSVHVND